MTALLTHGRQPRRPMTVDYLRVAIWRRARELNWTVTIRHGRRVIHTPAFTPDIAAARELARVLVRDLTLKSSEQRAASSEQRAASSEQQQPNLI